MGRLSFGKTQSEELGFRGNGFRQSLSVDVTRYRVHTIFFVGARVWAGARKRSYA